MLKQNQKMKVLCVSAALLTLPGCMTSQRQDQLQGSIDRLQTQIFELQTKMASRDQQVASATQSTLASQNNLDTLKNQLQLTQGDVDELKTKVKKMEQTAAPTTGVATIQNPPPSNLSVDVMRKVARIDLMTSDVLTQQRKEKLPAKIKTNSDLAKVLKNEFESGNFKEVISISSKVLNAQAATQAMMSSALQYRGEAKFQLQDYRGAAVDLGLYIEHYPNGSKYPRSLLIAGDCFVYLKKNNIARTYYDESARSFPTTPEGKAAAGRLASLDAQTQGQAPASGSSSSAPMLESSSSP